MSGESAKLDWSGRANLFVSPQLSPHLPPTINPSIQQLPPLQLEFPTLQYQAGPFPAATGTGLGSPSGLGPRTNHRTPDAGPNGFGPPSTGYGPRGFDTEQNSEFSSQTGGAGYDTGSVVGSENPEDVEDKPLQELPILGVEHLGSMVEYLAHCHIAINDYHTQLQLEHNKITHWTYFRRAHPDKLLLLRFADGPAHQLCDGLPRFIENLRRNRREIENKTIVFCHGAAIIIRHGAAIVIRHGAAFQRGFVDKEVPNKLHLVLLQGNPSMPLARDLLQPLVLFALLQALLCIPHQAKQRKESNNVGSVQRLSQRRSPHMDRCK
ncbi:hypothetical protein PtA15_15A425 [Puccinia triticina]|uniref:Uncharacterized protein n=1 Tax=Puccinia triticina TaxID=208348 RepID=A0ABY7D7P7_9BASI|nr:uncharacterized protein PtA15_15A425 [Puccinia triticina]WAQ92030.1 hypothetical protein PtA15_15A425 [Puccinia triticina]